MTQFDPNPGDTVEVCEEAFVVQVHPSAPRMAYAQEGGRATIFQVRDARGNDFALKVFKQAFRDPRQAEIARRLTEYRQLPGLRAAHRRVVAAGKPPFAPALDHAVVMPWIGGKTWFDTLAHVKANDEHVKQQTAIHLCHRFLDVLRALEGRGAAHTDIASGNVVIDMASLDVQLVDLEDLFGPDFPRPALVTRRTPGYTRDGLAGAGGFWTARGDRFAGVVLAAEILALSHPVLARMSRGDSFFDPAAIGDCDVPQFRAVMDYLRGLAPEFAELFQRAWTAPTLADCATLAECATSLEPLARRTPPPDGEFFVSSVGFPIILPTPVRGEDDDARRRAIVWKPLDLAAPQPPVPARPPPSLPSRPAPQLAPEPPAPALAPQVMNLPTSARLFTLLVVALCIIGVVVSVVIR